MGAHPQCNCPLTGAVLCATAPQGPPCVLYIGGFQEGLRHGLGEVLTSRGEAYQGYFEEDIMWGPGEWNCL